MASSPITSWQINGETLETVADLIFLGSKITADGDCSHEIKRRLLLGRKVMTNLDSILKSRDITLSTKVRLSKCFSSGHVWMWELDYKESWAPKNWCFWTVVSEKTLESSLDCKEIQPVHPKDINPGCSLGGLMLKLKLHYFGHLIRIADSFEKTLMLGKIEGRRRRGWQRMRCWVASPIQWTWVWVDSGSWWCTGRPGVLRFMGSQIVRHDWAIELNWTSEGTSYIITFKVVLAAVHGWETSLFFS